MIKTLWAVLTDFVSGVRDAVRRGPSNGHLDLSARGEWGPPSLNFNECVTRRHAAADLKSRPIVRPWFVDDRVGDMPPLMTRDELRQAVEAGAGPVAERALEAWEHEHRHAEQYRVGWDWLRDEHRQAVATCAELSRDIEALRESKRVAWREWGVEREAAAIARAEAAQTRTRLDSISASYTLASNQRAELRAEAARLRGAIDRVRRAAEYRREYSAAARHILEALDSDGGDV